MFSRLRSFLEQWIISLQTYPLTHLIVLIMTVLWVILIEQDIGIESTTLTDTLIKLLMTWACLLPLSIIRPKHLITQGSILVFGIIYYLVLAQHVSKWLYSDLLPAVGMIVLARIIPSVIIAREHQDSQDLTWSQFTQRWVSLIQWVIAGLILWWGVAASLVSIEFLFDVTIHSNIYQHIWVISVLCVWAWIWLINLQQQSELSIIQYPRWMRIFWQYIFLPLCGIYGLILISYGIKIIATGTWPQGQLVYMVAGYIWFWLLTWFTLLPLERNNLWLSKAYRILFISFVVTSWLIIGALIIRVSQYGWTIDRAMVMALIIWIIIMGVGSLIWTRKKWIIGLSSLVIIGALSICINPLLIRSYQLTNIQSLLTSTTTISTGDASKLYASVNYLSVNYGTGRLGQIFNSEQVSSLSWSNTWDLATNTMAILKISNYDITSGYDESTNNYFSFYSNNQWIFDIAWYKTLMQVDNYSMMSNTNDGLSVDKNIFTIATWGVNTIINFDLYISNFSNTQSKEQSTPYIITWDNYKLILTSANGQKNNWISKLEWFWWYLLLK